MKFILRNWWAAYKQTLKLNPKDVLKFTLVISATSLLISFVDGFKEGWLIGFICWTIGAVVFCYLLFAVICFIITYKHSKVDNILNKNGFCPEYLKAFEDTFVFGKPVDNNVYINYAIIHMELGNYKDALDILSALKVPETDINQRSLYIFIYMMLAAKMDDSALADDVWRCNQDFINANIDNPELRMRGYPLYLAMVYADCAAERYERALKTCNDIISTYNDKTNKGGKLDFMVMRILTLKKLGKDEELQSALNTFYSEIKDWKPPLEYQYNALIESAEKAAKGDIS